ncbi:type VI secretion system baseplate subunit TssK [Klebsiella pneumoniae]|uniref:type VI secretion system baseplate subunit TssK n=1 Tax=Klebsiella pneumoniae TaxID=573 RepID=UPI0007CCDEA0|nr:type VI secretion system baseplate subunit TssK [Klebsiella pneumoniae]HDT2742807.1 type VI secretion system baseplate subunit TssK [Klebsiella pneumoniae subsp. pneumoniae]EIV9917701.1 type VI secretion system baseplate subunit TssK [Klebsiella pneumoniae]EKV3433523.1 type VI secretion system baseplate subunit TssK [Klebsiella pneumoniae]ELA2733699.1 type VI secretion system baseplate subunit TssK [Klebsiella pneumoniae]ELA2739006.1 type VI secretion system baseplate subunit TssK [Klebsiel
MMKTERPLWGRGIMVSPQHFQQQAAYAAWTAEVIARMGLNHPWGVVEATFEPEMLKLGRLQAHRLQVRFQDGTMIDTDNADALPSALSLDGASGEAVIVLALPLMQANGGNCLKPEEVAERPVRFRQRWRDVRNQFGDDTRQIAVIQPELILRFAHQDNSDYLTCPLVRLQRDSQGAWLIDETFLPPLLQIQGSRWLATQLEQLLIQLRARLTRLMAMRRESNERMADFAVADVSLFWLLNALNSAEPVLGYFLRYRQSPPERLYPELARLAGSLLTFSLTHQANAVPFYQHDQLNAVFPPLFDLLSDLLEASLPSRVVAIALEHDVRLHFWQARLHDARLREGADYYLSVRSSVPVAQLQEQFPRQCKVGSPDHVKAIVNSSRTGVSLTPLRHVPAAIPLRLENQYFSLDVSHPLATEMLQSGTCMFYVPGMLGEPELELFAVLRT